jgi:hypothetical protein
MADERHRSELHRRKRAKNSAVLAVLLGAVVIIYLVALVRMGGG